MLFWKDERVASAKDPSDRAMRPLPVCLEGKDRGGNSQRYESLSESLVSVEESMGMG